MKNLKFKVLKEEKFLEWYDELIQKTKLAYHGPCKGTLFLGPFVVNIWENIQNYLNKSFKEAKIQNVLFPAVFPKNFLTKEKKHFSGFNPEVYQVIKPNQKDLEQDVLVLRPTSEILFNLYFSKTLINYQQLPIKLNQWANIFRYEKNPKPFLRNNEFYWQEGHALFEKENDGEFFCLKVIDIYLKFFQNYLAIPLFRGYKSELEKFSGAKTTYGFEVILEDGQFLQLATIHNLGKSFSKAFDVKVQGNNNLYFYPYGFSWGLSTRAIGGLISLHSDNYGLVLPPFIAPFQIGIIIYSNDILILKIVEKITSIIKKSNFSFNFLKNSKKSQSWIKNDYILNGVPLIIEIGKNELNNNNLSITTRYDLKKSVLDLKSFSTKYLNEVFLEIHEKMYQRQLDFSNHKIKEISNQSQIEECIKNKFGLKGYFNLNPENELKIKKLFQLTVRVILTEGNFKNKKCFFTSEPANCFAIFGRAY